MAKDVYEDIKEQIKQRDKRKNLIIDKISELKALKREILLDLDDLKPHECKAILIKYQVLFNGGIDVKIGELTRKYKALCGW